ncbi:hypothetical protein GBAR_LOCUS30847, partial [Geodia barretti]
HNLPARRPGICYAIRLLEEARATLRREDCERNKVQLFRALQTQPRNKNFEHVFHEATRENSNLQSLLQQLQTRIHMKDCELIDAQEELRMKEEHVLFWKGKASVTTTAGTKRSRDDEGSGYH